MKKILTLLFVIICLQSMAQKPSIQTSPAQLEEQRKKVEMMKKANRAKECADCVENLENATITRVSVTFLGIPASIPNMEAAFGKKRIDLYTKNGSFNINASFTGDPARKEYRVTKDNKNGSYTVLGNYFDETYSVIPTKTTTNKDINDNGLSCDILLMGLKESDFSCKSIELVFHYSLNNSYTKSASIKGIVSAKKGVDINVSQVISGKSIFYTSSMSPCYTSCY